jgi:hypothetical protein
VIIILGALDLATGKQRWSFGELEGPVVSTPMYSVMVKLFLVLGIVTYMP